MSEKKRRDVKVDFVKGTNLLQLVDVETGIPFSRQQKTIVESYQDKGAAVHENYSRVFNTSEGTK